MTIARRSPSPPAEARALAANLLASAEAAESDAFIFEFMAQKAGIPEREAGAMLVAFRQWRAEHMPKEYLESTS